MKITPQQKEILLDYLANFQEAGVVIYKNGELSYKDFDKARIDGVAEIKEITLKFISGKMSLVDFREVNNRLAIKHNYWGFTGLSGQMQLNLYTKHFEQSESGVKILREVIKLPKNKKEAKEKIEKIGKYLREARSSAENIRHVPWDKQAFLLSYFWEMQELEKFPIYYKSSRDTLSEIGFNLENYDTYAEEYLAFMETVEVINDLFNKKGVKNAHPVWFVEHVLWYQKWENTLEKKSKVESTQTIKFKDKERIQESKPKFAPSSWLPSIVSDLSQLAQNNETEWSKERGIKPEKAFETKLRYVFTLLGYDVSELGQGTGREPDGVARSLQAQDGYYAIVYDAKARGDEYSIGTDDRTIIEYIQKKKRELSKQRILRMYFVVISSEFSSNQSTSEAVRNIYKTTQVPVILLKADDLLFITEEKLKNVEIDHTILEDLFLEFGLLTKDKIVGVLGA